MSNDDIEILKDYTLIAKRVIRGHKCEVYCSRTGRFAIFDTSSKEILGESYELDGLETKVDKDIQKIKAIRIAVHFLNEHSDGTLHLAIAKGRHARTNDILIWEDDGTEKGRASTLSSYGRHHVLKLDLPQDQLDKRAKILKVLDRANELLQAWNSKYRFDLDAAVSTAIQEAEQERKEKDK